MLLNLYLFKAILQKFQIFKMAILNKLYHTVLSQRLNFIGITMRLLISYQLVISNCTTKYDLDEHLLQNSKSRNVLLQKVSKSIFAFARVRSNVNLFGTWQSCVTRQQPFLTILGHQSSKQHSLSVTETTNQVHFCRKIRGYRTTTRAATTTTTRAAAEKRN